ncbi:hypothetical protein R3P38DRAFT_1465243 [Favolaschia claudopus]|uniref:Uncharacterized protein n=1 Tax=Favolaschia claudopus TaxID=2862362 RepID=A0AAW0DLW7_9AGAR
MAFEPSATLPQHPCYQHHEPGSMFPSSMHVTLKYIKVLMGSIPSNYPYDLPAVEGLNFGPNALPVPFFDIRGHGQPSADIGTSGDIFIDLSAHTMYMKAGEDWAKWSGPAVLVSGFLTHPHFVEGKRARYLNFRANHGVEYVAAQTVRDRQLELREAGLLTDPDFYSLEASLGIASRIIQESLGEKAAVVRKQIPLAQKRVWGSFRKPSPAPTPTQDSSDSSEDLFASDPEASDSESESQASDDFYYPSKRARTLASSSTSPTSISTNRSKLKSPPSRARPHADPVIQKLEKELAALEADRALDVLKATKRSLLGSLDAPRKLAVVPELFKTLQKNYLYASVPSVVTPAEAEQALPDLRVQVERGKKALISTRNKRKEVEKDLVAKGE